MTLFSQVPDATEASVSNYILGLQGSTGPGTGETKKLTVQQVINLPGSTQYLPFSGGILTGALTLAGDPTTALEAATKNYADTKAPIDSPTFTGTVSVAAGAGLAVANTSETSVTSQGGSVWGVDDFKKVKILPNAGSECFNIQRVTSAGTDTYVSGLSWVLTDTAQSASPRFGYSCGINSNAGADPGEVWGNLFGFHTNAPNTSGHTHVSAYSQMVRDSVPSGKVGTNIEAHVFETHSLTGLPSSQDGIMRTVELDMFCAGADDYVGGVGREVMSIIMGKGQASDAAPTISSVIGIDGSAGYQTTVGKVLHTGSGLNISDSVVSSRGSTLNAGANAIWLGTNHPIALDTSAATKIASDGTTIAVTGAADFSGTVNGALGFQAPGMDEGGANVRLVGGNYGVMLRNDGSDFYVLLTPSGSPYGSFSGLRPLTVDLASGCVNTGDGLANWNANTVFSSKAFSGTNFKQWGLSAWHADSGTAGGGAIIARTDRTDGALVSFYHTASTNVGSITTDGTSTTYGTTSDYRLKVTHGLSDGSLIERVRVYDAEFKAVPGECYPMVLAHELAEAAPFAVTGEKDAVDEAGQILPQHVDYSKLVPALIAYVQKLEARVTALEA
jgi:hypothetical protein